MFIYTVKKTTENCMQLESINPFKQSFFLLDFSYVLIIQLVFNKYQKMS